MAGRYLAKSLGSATSTHPAWLQVQQLMAAQLAFALFGWLDAPAQSIFQDAATVVGNADQKDPKSLEDKYLVAGPHSVYRTVWCC